MKEYEYLIGKVIIAVAIIISGLLISNAVGIGLRQVHDAIFISIPR